MQKRYELRFFVPPVQALRIRDFVREYLELDEHAVGKPDFSYPVHTLHLDSDDWKLYWRTVRGDQDRWKLRLRYYSSLPDSPVFCEVKHQLTDVVVKYRAGLRREAVDAVLAGCLPGAGQLLGKGPKQAGAVERFVAMMGELNARPKLHLFWMREAYESYDGKARVTLDRCICVSEVSAITGKILPNGMDTPLLSAQHTVVLELRFTDRFPDWYRELVRIFELGQPLFWKGDQAKVSCAGLRLTQGELIYNIVL